MIQFLLDRFEKASSNEALVWQNRSCGYGQLLAGIHTHQQCLKELGVPQGAVVSLEADYSPNAIALMLALIKHRCIVVPLTPQANPQLNQFKQTAQVEWSLTPDSDQGFKSAKSEIHASHELYDNLRTNQHAGLVLFSSGSTGACKAAVHSWPRLLAKFRQERKCYRTLAVLLFDHIGGIDTLFYSLSNASCLIIPDSLSAEDICQAIQDHQVEVLPVSPSFLNVLILSQTYETYDLSSVKYVTYGAEVMPMSTLKKCHEIFPQATLLQKYGTTETGALRSKSKSSDSLWVKIGGEGYQTRVVDGLLEIKAESAMLGYMNAPSPFTEDGWFQTGDMVLVDGEFIKILGRQSDTINVGGEKVYPQEIENVLLSMGNVVEATVKGEAHPILGQIVAATLQLQEPESTSSLRRRVKIHCQGKLPEHKIPVKVRVSESSQVSPRFKKMR